MYGQIFKITNGAVCNPSVWAIKEKKTNRDIYLRTDQVVVEEICSNGKVPHIKGIHSVSALCTKLHILSHHSMGVAQEEQNAGKLNPLDEHCPQTRGTITTRVVCPYILNRCHFMFLFIHSHTSPTDSAPSCGTLLAS